MHINTAKGIVAQLVQEQTPIHWRGSNSAVVVSFSVATDEAWVTIISNSKQGIYPLTHEQFIAMACKSEATVKK